MKILLVRLRLIGDVVFTTPLVRALRRRFSDAHLTYLVEPAAEPVVRGNPHLDEVIVVPKRTGLRRWVDDLTMGRRLRTAQFDLALDLHGGPRGAWLTWASGARMRIGYAMRGRSWMYTHPVRRPADLAPQHSVLNQWALLAPLDVTECDPADNPVEIADDAAATARLDARLAALGITPSHTLVVVHVSAGNLFRRWPAESFVDLVVRLAERDERCRVLLISGPSEPAAARRIASEARRRLEKKDDRVPDIGEFDLFEIRALIARAAVYVGGDTGPLHIASTTTTPIVALLGPTLPERSMPWRDPRWFAEAVDAGPLPCRPCQQRKCTPGDFRCLTWITPDRVLDAAKRALAHGTKPRCSDHDAGVNPRAIPREGAGASPSARMTDIEAGLRY